MEVWHSFLYYLLLIKYAYFGFFYSWKNLYFINDHINYTKMIGFKWKVKFVIFYACAKSMLTMCILENSGMCHLCTSLAFIIKLVRYQCNFICFVYWWFVSVGSFVSHAVPKLYKLWAPQTYFHYFTQWICGGKVYSNCALSAQWQKSVYIIRWAFHLRFECLHIVACWVEYSLLTMHRMLVTWSKEAAYLRKNCKRVQCCLWAVLYNSLNLTHCSSDVG